MAASVEATQQAINQACRSRGGKYARYSCQVVSWDDVSRGTEDGSLSCWGSNITDTYLKSKDCTPLYTVRSDNWNEKLGRVSTNEIALVAGNHVAGGGPLGPGTLRDFLQRAGMFGGYAGLDGESDLSDETLDANCSIRFQTTFLPVSGERGTMEFATEAYNYNTHSDDDPRNLVLLCTTQGVAVQQDGEGAKRLFHHAVDDDGVIHRYWLEAERSDHKVGGQQRETAEERADALTRGKATASVIGTRAMGTRFNVLMTIQVPLQQKAPPSEMLFGGGATMNCAMMYNDECDDMGCDDDFMCCAEMASLEALDVVPQSMQLSRQGCGKGVANAARVSRGTEHDVWSGLSVEEPKRHASEHVTATVVIYNTVANGIPVEADVVAAIDDLEALYEACGASGRLGDQSFDFMKQELAAKDVQAIDTKLTTQPYKPPTADVVGFDTFPA
eukprot:TRINITY_DN3298_c0_g1_i1.p1 TRINITY_DN3298_c0_g1~~TRINITY_DN3298_c0_g1_i1.p1  ORF type:complete len:461 (+),score=99.57 TRINITY_DN3298_c0_g1_i1:51-1385(+)